jgi:integrase
MITRDGRKLQGEPAHDLPSGFSMNSTNTIKGLALPSGVADRTYWDDIVGGFGLRLRTGGSATYVVQYDIAGKTRRVTLGPVTLLDIGMARTKAKELLAQVRMGLDPAAMRRERRAQAAETFGAMLPRYLIVQQRAIRANSFKQTERRLCKLARPLHPLPLAAINRRTVSSLLATVADRNGPTAAANCHSSLSGYFRWLVGEGLLDENPMLYANKPKPGPARARMLTESELRTLWAALGDDDYGDIIKLLIYTASRRSEIGDLRWDEVDLDGATVELPPARMKNGRFHLIPLSEPALAILRKRQRNGRDHVFGRGKSGFQSWSRSRAALNKSIGSLPPWVLHDFRRLVSTTMHEKLGIPPHIVDRVLAHVGHQGGTRGIYNRSVYADEMRRALRRWAHYVDAVVTEKPMSAQVVQLRKRT